MNWLRNLLLTAVLSAFPVAAYSAGPDSEYVEIFNLIKQGDDHVSRGRNADAAEAYHDAHERLERFREDHKSWNPSVVRFRTKYVSEQLDKLGQGIVLERPVEELRQQLDQSEASRTALEALRGRIQQLEGEKTNLEARLTEALRAQPAAVDPRELEKAEAQIAQLTREKALIQAQLETSEGEIANLQAKSIDSGVLEEADRKITEQSDRIAMLELEKGALQRRLEEMRAGTNTTADGGTIQLQDPAEEEQTREALLEAADRIAEFETELAQMRNLRVRLEQRVATVEAANTQLAEEKAALQDEVTTLRAQLATGVDVAALNARLAEVRTQLSSARQENEALKAEQADAEALRDQLRERIEELESQPLVEENRELKLRVGSTNAEIDQLRSDLARLESELQNANADAAKKSKVEDRSKVVALGHEITWLKSQLAVLQAQQVPYTEEELALFKEPSAVEDTMNQQVSREDARRQGLMSLPAGASKLITEAQRAFVQGNLGEAESLYREVLALDEDNVFSISNLAAILIEEGKLDEAETLIERALQIDPQDGYSQTLLGMSKFREGDYDAAMEALSKAVQIDPNDPQTQMYLGITLSQQGLRKQAETALRKAVALAPGNATAHYNLAVVYATQQPPFPKLAEHHYNTAIANGHPRSEELEAMFAKE